VFADKPVIGIAGGIGSGKSFVAERFGEEGCFVINSDALVREAYKDPTVKQSLKRWWGSLILDPNGEIDRSAVARKIFTHPDERKRLEQLLHPRVGQVRERLMRSRAEDAQVLAFVWDTPLLFENGINRHCDAVVFVDAPAELRFSRVNQSRRWSREEWEAREKLQMPLDKKREMSQYVISNTAGADEVRAQVREVLSRILAGSPPTARPH
jgi:dephospho-CoA kinase